MRHNLLKTIVIEALFLCTHSPWQRDTIERINGIIGRDMPTILITDCTVRDIEELARAINSTPRKGFDFNTLAKTFLENLACCT